MRNALRQARQALESSEALLVAAGAGMGVDSGLPDFRGTEGFWRAHPPFKTLGLSFEELNPHPDQPRESRVLAGHIGLALGALESLSALQERGAGEGSPFAGG